MIYDLRVVFILFMLYSFLGWLMELELVLIDEGKVINRGFLIGPYCPIYGIGVLTMILLLTKYLDDKITLFIMCILLFSVLEYFTNYIMEKLFKARWWDYSQFKFNINGRICLETMIPFGLCGLLVMYIINPLFVGIIDSLPSVLLTVLTIVLGVLFITDIVISTIAVSSVKKTAKKVKQDNTEEITTKVKELLLNKNYLKRRLVKAFPKLKIK